LARLARRSAASCLSSACWVDSNATCAARRSAVVPRGFVGRVDTVTLCLAAAIILSFSRSHVEFSVRVWIASVWLGQKPQSDTRRSVPPGVTGGSPHAEQAVKYAAAAGVRRRRRLAQRTWVMAHSVSRDRRAAGGASASRPAGWRGTPCCGGRRPAAFLPFWLRTSPGKREELGSLSAALFYQNLTVALRFIPHPAPSRAG
jgi:hypothetical protein